MTATAPTTATARTTATATSTATAASSATAPSPTEVKAARLLSLDIFRGITIAGMLAVNNPGSWATIHTPAPPCEVAWLDGGRPDLPLLPLHCRCLDDLLAGEGVVEGDPSASDHAAGGPARGDTLCARVSATVVLLLGYWAALAWVPVPGLGAGVWEPGQDLGAYLDRAIFGTQHLWAQARSRDPEGILGTLPAIASLLIGTFAGNWLRSPRPERVMVLGLLGAGVVGIDLGQPWSLVFPINKSLWTTSYVVFTIGMALLALGLAHWLIDLKGYRGPVRGGAVLPALLQLQRDCDSSMMGSPA